MASGHQATYHQNQAYADFLASLDPKFYAKYTDTLMPPPPGGSVLDVGCGVGQALKRLTQAGYDAYGVDVSQPNVTQARAVTPKAQLYDGQHLPFPDDSFASAGAFNVLEHVEQPEPFLQELVRVVAPQGRITVSSPNFFRVIGWRDYHPKMRGLRNKTANARRILAKYRATRRQPESVHFDPMTPIVKKPFTPDDDAIIATNGLEIAFFLRRYGCTIDRIECTDRYVPRLLDRILNLTPLRFLILNAFVVATKGTAGSQTTRGV